MSEEFRHLRVTCTIKVPPEAVYNALIHPTALRDWFCNRALVEAQPGGGLFFWWDTGYYACGEFVTLEVGKTVQYNWRGKNEPDYTAVQINLEPVEGGTQLTLIHGAVPCSQAWDTILAEFKHGWETGVENLQSVLETGVDLREVRRPMLGINLDEMNAQYAEKYQLPVKEGILILGTVEGLGARKAGLKEGDAMISLDGSSVRNIQDLRKLIAAHKAGDVVSLSFFRGREKLEATMTLSQRPMPESPPTALALAEIYQRDAGEFQAKLSDKLQGASEAQADFTPEANAWNTRQVLAHMVACERDLQSWISNMINNLAIADTLEYCPNVNTRLNAMLKVYPTLADLLAEFKRSQAETFEMVYHLPAEFMARKNYVLRLSQWITNSPYHYKDHLDQISNTLPK
jgi:uncharacterized protein YndB with AHSA1/START domain